MVERILNYADFKISNGPIEGINNRIGKIRAKMYGCKDFSYFMLKVLFSFLPLKYRTMDIKD